MNTNTNSRPSSVSNQLQLPILNSEPTSNDQISYYYTTDTALASWLHSKGHVIQHFLLTDSPYTFIFVKNNDLLKAVSDWQKGEAIGNCFLFEHSRRELVRIIKKNGK